MEEPPSCWIPQVVNSTFFARMMQLIAYVVQQQLGRCFMSVHTACYTAQNCTPALPNPAFNAGITLTSRLPPDLACMAILSSASADICTLQEQTQHEGNVKQRRIHCSG